jgi:CBS domain-containing protein
MSTDSRPDPLEPKPAEPLHASDLMAPVPQTCSPFSTVTEAMLILRDQGLGMVPVVDLGKPVGIVTEPEANRAVNGQADSGLQPVSTIMKPEFLTAQADTPVDQVLRMMGDASVPVLLVVDAEGLLLGAISRTDVTARTPGASTESAFESTKLVEVDQP